MSDRGTFRCTTCAAPLGGRHQLFGFQSNQLSYELPGETPSDQALMRPSQLSFHARFCGSTCCERQLAALLEEQGLPSHLQQNRVYGGPIATCGKCGKPVNMTQPHGAWIRGEVTSPIQQGVDAAPAWFDVLTVVCAGCTVQVAAEGGKRYGRQATTFERLMQELDALEAQEDSASPHKTRREPSCGA